MVSLEGGTREHLASLTRMLEASEASQEERDERAKAKTSERLAAVDARLAHARQATTQARVVDPSPPRIARQTMLVRLTPLTTGKLVWQCGDHTGGMPLIPHDQTLLFSVARGSAPPQVGRSL